MSSMIIKSREANDLKLTATLTTAIISTSPA